MTWSATKTPSVIGPLCHALRDETRRQWPDVHVGLVRPPKDGQDFDGFLDAIKAMGPGPVIAMPTRTNVPRRIGEFFMGKYRGRVTEVGHRAVATQLRKQGVPLEQALLILLGAEERFAHLHKGAA